MPTTKEPVHVEAIADQIEFEVPGGETVKLDIVEGNFLLEKFATEVESGDQMLSKIKEWFADQGHEITTTQAHRFFVILRGAYAAVKKKLEGTLTSLFTSMLIPSNSQEDTPTPSTENSLDS